LTEKWGDFLWILVGSRPESGSFFHDFSDEENLKGGIGWFSSYGDRLYLSQTTKFLPQNRAVRKVAAL